MAAGSEPGRRRYTGAPSSSGGRALGSGGRGLRRLSSLADSFEEYLRETAERPCSMSNLYVLNKASSSEPQGRS